MDRQIFEVQMIDYLEGELSAADLVEFQTALQQNPEWRFELEAFAKLRNLYRSHLPLVVAPADLAERTLARLPKPERKSWAFFGMGAFWRPVLTGAFVLAFTLMGTYEYKRWRDNSLPVAQAPVVAPAETQTFAALPSRAGGDFGDPSFAPTRSRPYRSPAWRSNPNPRLAGGGQVSLASFGNSTSGIEDMGGTSDINSLEEEAQLGLAQFLHQQALRLNGLGDHQGAAEGIAELVKKYPSYPRIFEAMALRIGCLFQLGQVQKAQQELTWLRQNSPGLAELVEQRWKGSATLKNAGPSSVL